GTELLDPASGDTVSTASRDGPVRTPIRSRSGFGPSPATWLRTACRTSSYEASAKKVSSDRSASCTRDTPLLAFGQYLHWGAAAGGLPGGCARINKDSSPLGNITALPRCQAEGAGHEMNLKLQETRCRSPGPLPVMGVPGCTRSRDPVLSPQESA